jgi:hypothetical protein
VAGQPYLGIWIELRHVAIEIFASRIIAILLRQALLEAGEIARICVFSAVANLSSESTGLLSTATAKVEVVVFLVVGCGAFAVPYRKRSALQPYDDGGIFFIDVQVPSKTVTVPAEPGIARPVEAPIHILPITGARHIDVGICCHLSKGQDSCVVCHIGARNCIHRPR